MEETTITLKNSTLFNLLKWFEQTNINDFNGKIYPFENKSYVYTTRNLLLEELKIREIKFDEMKNQQLINLYNNYHYINLDSFYDVRNKSNKRKKKIFISYGDSVFRLKTMIKEINKRKIDLKLINTKQLLKWYKVYRFEEDLLIPYGLENITHIKEIKKELDKRENILNKSENKNIRQLCAKHGINKAKALKIIKEIK
jgi:hypothetical protein